MRIQAECAIEARAECTTNVAVELLKPTELQIGRYVEYCLANRTDFNVCWPWPEAFARTNHGYGVMSHEGIPTVYAHRLAYRLTTGEQPAVVMHTCDTPCCFNPFHLVGGTHEMNMLDMVRKGRHKSTKGLKGCWNPCTPEEVRQIRQWRAEGVSRKEIVARTGRAASTITNIVHCKRHKDVR